MHFSQKVQCFDKNHAKKIVLVGKLDVLVWVKGGWSWQLPKKTRVSIWPIEKQIFKMSKGLKWPLNGLTMKVTQN